LARLYRQKLGQQLEWRNWGLEDLDRRFGILIAEHRIPHLIGAEAYENRFIFHRKWLPRFLRLVVEKESAARYFPPARQLPGTDHFTTVKPDRADHPSHIFLCTFLRELERQEQQWGLHKRTSAAEGNGQPTPHGFSLEVLVRTMSNPRYEDDRKRLEPLYDIESVINMDTIVIVVGTWVFAELLDRTIAEILRDHVNSIGKVDEHPFRRAIILTDVEWYANKKITNNALISIGGPPANRLSAEFDTWQGASDTNEGKYIISGKNVLTGFFRRNERGLPQVGLWGKTSSDTRDAVEYYINAEKGLVEFLKMVWNRH